jgi:pimeloyl-ACP methyl ester carboxylesterase
VLSAYSGGALFGERHGEAPLKVLFLHGWGRTHHDYDAVVAELDVPSIALDLPGFGATPEPPQRWTSQDFARAVAPILGESTEPIVIVGHSHGGRVAAALCAMAPERIAAVVFIGAPLIRKATTAQPSFRYRLLRWMNAKGWYSDQRMERLRQSRGSSDYRNASGVMRETMVTVVNESFEEQLATITCPVRMVWGELDTDVPVRVAHEAAAVLGSSDVAVSVVPGIGHLVPTAAPQAVVEAIREVMS